MSFNNKSFSMTKVEPLNTWEKILQKIVEIKDETELEKKIDFVIELLVNIRLLGKESSIIDKRNLKHDIEKIYAEVLDKTKDTLNSMELPSSEYIYYFREVLKKLPIRSGGNDLIEDIRSASEYFEEGRDGDDPLLSFAGDLRKEVHRKLSPGIITKYIKPYLAMVKDGDSSLMFQAGYMAVASNFEPDSEDKKFIELATELEEKLSYLWNYEKGDISTVKNNLKNSLDIFDKCFLKKEMQTFLDICNSSYISEMHNLTDCLKRLSSFKALLKKSFFEGRINLFDLLNLDLDVGRLVFIFTNDLTNNHYEKISFANITQAVALVRELIILLNVKGIIIERNDKLLKELTEIFDKESVDILKVKKTMQNISIGLQQFMKNNIFQRLGQTLNIVLEAYQIPTSSLAPIKDRFFNNFIRRTESHAVNEFIEKIIVFLNKELATRSAENSLYGKYTIEEMPDPASNYSQYIATTWIPTSEEIRPYLGGKGNSIVDMKNLNIDIPPAFIIGLPICDKVFEGTVDKELFEKTVLDYIRQLEKVAGRQLGSVEKPLIVSVRSGTTVSLPGSMCTILNTGTTPAILQKIKEKYSKEFADGIYIRFLKNTLTALEDEIDQETESKIDSETFIDIAQEKIRQKLGDKFLNDPVYQLMKCIGLVFASSRFKNVKDYLKELSIQNNYGTAVTIQQMVFGNKNNDCMSGVYFTRNPISGADELFGEYKELTQGEDIVMGNVITKPVSQMPEKIRQQLQKCKEILEKELKYELDIEFTVEDGRLYLLQTRRATVSTYAGLLIDVDMMKKGLISVEEFKKRLDRTCATNTFISVPRAEEEHREWKPPLCKGVPINHGIVCGSLALTPEMLKEGSNHENIIYIAQNTKPSDFQIINNSNGIITVYPGRTSHAAITSVTLNKPCVVGCSNLIIDLENKNVTFKGEMDTQVKEGELITLDANSGYVYRGTVPLTNSFIQTSNIVDSIKNIHLAADVAFEVEKIIHEKIVTLKKETGFQKKNIQSIQPSEFEGKNVLVRLDLNVPVFDGKITDTTRIDAAIPTIKYLLKAKATPVLCSHLGDPGKKEKAGQSREQIYSIFSLAPVAQYMKKTFPEMVFHEKSIASSGLLISKDRIVKGRVNLLENLRFAIGEKENDAIFARCLADLSDGIYVNDAFGTCHRSHASISAVTRYAKNRLAGMLIEKELKYLGSAVSSPQKPFVAITGGSKISSKLGVIESLLKKIDVLIVGGGIGYTLLKAKGVNVEKSLVEEAMLDTARKLLDRYGEKIVLPVDFVITDKLDFKELKAGKVKRNVTTIDKGWESFDLGDMSIDNAVKILKDANTILWNGPIGAFEIDEGSAGTLRLAAELAQIAQKGKTVIIGGGDSSSAVQVAKVADKMTHVSTGGGASLEFLERLSLPGISVLDPE